MKKYFEHIVSSALFLFSGILIAFILLNLLTSVTQASIVGDINHDGVVDNADLAILQSQWGVCGPVSGNLEISEESPCVDTIDFNILASHFGETEVIPLVISGGQGFQGSGGGCDPFVLGTTIHSPCFWDSYFAFSGIFPCMKGHSFNFMTGAKCTI